ADTNIQRQPAVHAKRILGKKFEFSIRIFSAVLRKIECGNSGARYRNREAAGLIQREIDPVAKFVTSIAARGKEIVNITQQETAPELKGVAAVRPKQIVHQFHTLTLVSECIK